MYETTKEVLNRWYRLQGHDANGPVGNGKDLSFQEFCAEFGHDLNTEELHDCVSLDIDEEISLDGVVGDMIMYSLTRLT